MTTGKNLDYKNEDTSSTDITETEKHMWEKQAGKSEEERKPGMMGWYNGDPLTDQTQCILLQGDKMGEIQWAKKPCKHTTAHFICSLEQRKGKDDMMSELMKALVMSGMSEGMGEVKEMMESLGTGGGDDFLKDILALAGLGGNKEPGRDYGKGSMESGSRSGSGSWHYGSSEESGNALSEEDSYEDDSEEYYEYSNESEEPEYYSNEYEESGEADYTGNYEDDDDNYYWCNHFLHVKNSLTHWDYGPHFNIKIIVPGIGILFRKIKRLWGHLIYILGISILLGRHLHIHVTPFSLDLCQ